jgi:tRNA G18 (ribose-2'-O)-methylase SpoU
MRVERVGDAADPRLDDFVRLRDVQLRITHERAGGLFVAEGETTIRRALRAGYEPRAVLCAERWLDTLNDVLGEDDVPALVVDDDVLAATVGFPVHRGALASFHRRPLPSPEDVLRGARSVAVLADLNDHTNLGAVFRSAAALGIDAVVLTPGSADPLYRRAVRTSMGAVFTIPWTRIDPRRGPPLLRDAGFDLLALTPSPDAVALSDVDVGSIRRPALALGSEGHGLSDPWLRASDLLVRIPMREGVDSLNVAAAAAVAFYALTSSGLRARSSRRARVPRDDA